MEDNNLSEQDSFLRKTQDYISTKLNNSSFRLDDESLFSPIEEPYTLWGKRYQINTFHDLTGFRPNKDKPEPLLYTFYLLRPLDGVKEKFLDELKKKDSGQNHDSSVVGDYYAPFVPGNKEFDVLSGNLAGMLSNDYFPNKGYEFEFSVAVPTKDSDIALVFLEVGSFDKLRTIYPEGIPFDPAE